MSARFDESIKGMSTAEKAQAKQLVEGLDDLFVDLNIGDFARRIIKAGIDWAQATLLPKLQERNAMLAAIVAGLLDALENAVK